MNSEKQVYQDYQHLCINGKNISTPETTTLKIDTIYQGDCLDLMAEIPDKSLDLILCDLPYGTTQNKWDTAIDLTRLWNHYNRVIKDNAAILLFAQAPFDKVLAISNLEMFRYEYIWIKHNPTGHLNANRMPLKAHETILVFYKHLPVYNPQREKGVSYQFTGSKRKVSTNYHKIKDVMTESNGYGYPIDILCFNRVLNGVHPTQKPVNLCEYLIKTYTNEQSLILDNCIGSGTTAIAAFNTSRHFIGVEKDQTYYQIALERIDRARNNMEVAS